VSVPVGARDRSKDSFDEVVPALHIPAFGISLASTAIDGGFNAGSATALGFSAAGFACEGLANPLYEQGCGVITSRLGGWRGSEARLPSERDAAATRVAAHYDRGSEPS
jgi:hypothetical protein